MDYEKKYKDALLRAKKLHDEPTGGTEKIVCEQIFPELKETKEAKIIRAVARVLDENYMDSAVLEGVEIAEIRAWLEKQNEQKPTDKVEPKFKVGDWICTDMCIAHITLIKNGMYYFDDENSLAIAFADKYYHLWTIQDARDGDVLHSIGFHSDCIFIFDELDNWKFDEPDGERAVATGYCCLTLSEDNMEFGIQGPDCIEVDTLQPATKVQRDLLFKKMKEAGYERDTENKDLKKTETQGLDPDKVIAWLQSYGYDITTLIHDFKEHFGL